MPEAHAWEHSFERAILLICILEGLWEWRRKARDACWEHGYERGILLF